MDEFQLDIVFKDKTDKYPKLYWPSIYEYYKNTTILHKLIDDPKLPEKPGCLAAIFGLTSDYKYKFEEYKIAKEKHDDHEKKRIKLFDEIRNPEKYQKKHIENLKKIILSAELFKIDYKNPSVGITEKVFLEKLKERFDNKIYINKIFEFTEVGNPYAPDFIFYDKQTNLLIDIEIDEPYVLKKGTPTHYIYCDNEFGINKSVDIYRDIYFTSKGWFVIRFCENQILNYCNECINLIENLFLGVKMLLKNDTFSYKPSKIKFYKTWTIFESLDLFKKNYREKIHNIETNNIEPHLDNTHKQHLLMNDEVISLRDAFQKLKKNLDKVRS